MWTVGGQNLSGPSNTAGFKHIDLSDERFLSSTQQNANSHPSFELLQHYRQQEDETEENFGSFWGLIKRLTKPRWGVSTVGGGDEERCCECCVLLSISSVPCQAGRPWILPRIAGSSHFQSGNKSGLYGPGGAHCSHCSPDGLLRGQITQERPRLLEERLITAQQ